MLILSADLGTSSVKMSVLDEELNLLASTKVDYQIRVLNGDWVELDADVVFGAMIAGIRNLSRYAGQIGLIGFDAFSPSMTLMDAEGDALYPILTHLDRRSKEQTKEILQVMGKDRFQHITGIQPFTGGASVTSAMWIKENVPEVFQKADHLGHLNTYIYKKLTGVWATDPTNASMMGMYETLTGIGWSREICETFGIPLRMLPEIRDAGGIAGHLTEKTAGLCGLRAGIPVAVGSNDAATAQIGAGNTHAGDILDISGSSEMVSILTDQPKADDRYYLRNACTPGMWQIFAITTSGFAIDWFRNEFYKDMDQDTFFNHEVPEVIGSHIDHCEVGFLPYINGDRQSLTPKRGGFTGLTLNATRKDFLASIFLGIHEPILDTIRICEGFMTLNKTIKLTGGMLTPQFIELKRKLFTGYDFEVKLDCPIIGNAILALAGLRNERKAIL